MSKFQFTHPGRGATKYNLMRFGYYQVSIHAPREGCDDRYLEVLVLLVVSIHAPREGCDYAAFIRLTNGFVSIHAPREGCDTSEIVLMSPTITFQFTHPGRGATWACPRQRAR